MGEVPVVVEAWARLVERCTHCRAHGLDTREVAGWDGGGGTLVRHLRASEAGQDGLLSLILRRRLGPETTLGAELGRLIRSLQTLILMSGERLDLMLTFHPRHVVLAPEAAEVVRDATLLVLLWTLDDGAANVALTLERGEGGQVVSRLESGHAGLIPLPVNRRAILQKDRRQSYRDHRRQSYRHHRRQYCRMSGLLAVIRYPTHSRSFLAVWRNYGWKENPPDGHPQPVATFTGNQQPERGSACHWPQLAYCPPLSPLG